MDAMLLFIRGKCKLAYFDCYSKSLVEFNKYFNLLDKKSKEEQDAVKPQAQTRSQNNPDLLPKKLLVLS